MLDFQRRPSFSAEFPKDSLRPVRKLFDLHKSNRSLRTRKSFEVLGGLCKAAHFFVDGCRKEASPCPEKVCTFQQGAELGQYSHGDVSRAAAAGSAFGYQHCR